MDAEDTLVRRRTMDRERKRMVRDSERRMSGERRLQHIVNAIMKRAAEARKGVR